MPELAILRGIKQRTLGWESGIPEGGNPEAYPQGYSDPSGYLNLWSDPRVALRVQRDGSAVLNELANILAETPDEYSVGSTYPNSFWAERIRSRENTTVLEAYRDAFLALYDRVVPTLLLALAADPVAPPAAVHQAVVALAENPDVPASVINSALDNAANETVRVDPATDTPISLATGEPVRSGTSPIVALALGAGALYMILKGS